MLISTLLRTAVLAPALGFAAGAAADVVDTRMLEENVPVDTASPHVRVKNVFGSVRVVTHDQNVVRMTAEERVRGDTQADVERARAEMALLTERDGDEIAFVVRDPDDDDDCNCRWRDWRWDDGHVEYDIELRVPREATLDVSTVNGGEIVLEGVHGEFEAQNVNGPVRLRDVRGPGAASSVNGGVEASFDEAPQEGVSFKTVNGRIDVQFPETLAAELQFKTLNGKIWTDFDAEPVPAEPVRAERHGARYVLRSDSRAAVRVGGGGPAHSFQTVNGDIYVREATR